MAGRTKMTNILDRIRVAFSGVKTSDAYGTREMDLEIYANELRRSGAKDVLAFRDSLELIFALDLAYSSVYKAHLTGARFNGPEVAASDSFILRPDLRAIGYSTFYRPTHGVIGFSSHHVREQFLKDVQARVHEFKVQELRNLAPPSPESRP
jgi:hypothetical protein